MWAAPVAMFDAKTVFVALFFILWSVAMGTYIHFRLRAPAALRRWADAEGYQIIERKQAGFFGWFSFAAGSGHHVFKVVVRDRESQEHRGLVRGRNALLVLHVGEPVPGGGPVEGSHRQPGAIQDARRPHTFRLERRIVAARPGSDPPDRTCFRRP